MNKYSPQPLDIYAAVTVAGILMLVSFGVLIWGGSYTDVAYSSENEPTQEEEYGDSSNVILHGAALAGSQQATPYRDWSVVEPELFAPFAYAVDLESGFVFYHAGARDVRWPIASISKLVTALVVDEMTKPGDSVVVTQSAIDTEGHAGYFRAGDIYSVEDLVAIMLLTSSNDATMALAEHIGLDETVEAMNRVATEIGMMHTTFVEPTGLSSRNQSTVVDLRMLMKHLYDEHPHILAMTAQRSERVHNRATGLIRDMNNINYFAGYSNFAGGKTGYIDSSGENLVAVFEYEDAVILTVIMASPDRYGETQQMLDFIKAGYQF